MDGFRSGRGRGILALAFVSVLLALTGAASAQAETLVFGPGPEQTFVVPSGVTHIKVTAIGEKGRNICLFGSCFSGFSEKVTTTLTVTPGEHLYADFAGAGSAGGVAGRGGVAADLRTIPQAEAGSLSSRLVVAAGGGGEGEEEEGNFAGQGGNAGASEGGAGNPDNSSAGTAFGGGGGTQAKGGAGGSPAGGTTGEPGSLGQGGKGGTGAPNGDAGGGGGGYYGGGGGGAGNFAGAGGGGGSSFVAAGGEETSFALNTIEEPTGVTVTYAGGTETIPFPSSGSEQSFVVPLGVSRVKVIAVGENGQDRCCGGGRGETVTASVSVKHGQRYFIDFGGGGSSNIANGGNASDLRAISRAEAGSLESRLVVAGGGGGDGISEENSRGGEGGNAGFLEGGTGGGGFWPGGGGGGGTQKNGGAAGKAESTGEAGKLGQGGTGGANSEGDGGGGGGGYYGGGGGGGGCCGSSGGGGGSSFVVAGAEEVSAGLNGSSKEQPKVSIIYKSAAPPSASISTPAEGQGYHQGEGVQASYGCSEGAGGPGIESCTGTVANGSAIDTSTPGEHQFTVTATSKDGLTAAKTVTYFVAGPPAVSITTPAEGAHYKPGEAVDASYSCSEGAGGPGLRPGAEGCSGTVANGSAIDTSPGAHEFTVLATSKDGQTASKTVKYTVAGNPTVTVTAPTEGAGYKPGQVVDASYSCSDGEGAPGLKPGTEGCKGTAENGAPIDTTAGTHEFTVTATSQDGQTASKTVKYTVAGAPTASITSPAEGAVYLKGQIVDAEYSCSEGASGPGLKPGAEGCSGTVPDGSAIDTSLPGEHHFSVTATSTDGQSSTATVSYDVAAPPVFGRCVKEPKGSKGSFANATCTEPSAAATGRFEWLPGPGPGAGFSLAGQAASPIALETTSKKALTCATASGSGTITGLTTVAMTLVFSGCQDGGEECTNTASAGQVQLALTGTLAPAGEPGAVYLKLLPSSVFQYQCSHAGTPGTSARLETSGILMRVRIDRGLRTVTDFLSARKGRQVPESLGGEPPLLSQEIRTEHGKEEPVGVALRATLVQTFEERYEINSAF